MSKCKVPELGNLLLAYEMDGLTENETERFEAHLIECEHCFNELESFKQEADLLSRDEDVKNLVSGVVRQGQRQPEPFLKKLRRYLWPETPVIFKPALAYFLILVMIIPAYQGLMKSGGDSIRTPQTVNLIPDRSTQQEVFGIGKGEDGLITFVFRGALPGREYQIVIESENGEVLMRNDHFDAFDNYETGRLLLPLGNLGAGHFRLIITDPGGESPWNRKEYSFQIEK